MIRKLNFRLKKPWIMEIAPLATYADRILVYIKNKTGMGKSLILRPHGSALSIA
jgi:hypothetical protein